MPESMLYRPTGQGRHAPRDYTTRLVAIRADGRRGGPDQPTEAPLTAPLAVDVWWQAVRALAVDGELLAMLGSRAADLEEVAYSLGTQRQPTALWLAACQGLGLVERYGDAYRLGPAGRELLAAADQPQSAPTAEPPEARARAALWTALVGGVPATLPPGAAPATTALLPSE